jgi:hypothetical protein
MRSVLCVLAVLFVIPVFADDKPPVRGLNETNVKLTHPGFEDQTEGLTEIRTAEELAKTKVFADDASREAIRKQVDFSKEKVVVFTWWGRTPSSARVKLAKDGKTVVFSVVTADPALADYRHQGAVFAAPRDVPVVCGFLQELRDLFPPSLKDVKVDFSKGGNEPKPLEIKSLDQLAKADVFADEASRAAIKKQVDFSKDKVVVFVWSGSGQDKLIAALSEDGKTAEFTYSVGKTDDLRHYARVFALPRDCELKMVK